VASTFLRELDSPDVGFAFISHVAQDLRGPLVGGRIGQPTALRHSGLHTLQHILGHRQKNRLGSRPFPPHDSLADDCCQDATIVRLREVRPWDSFRSRRHTPRPTRSRLGGAAIFRMLSNDLEQIVGLYVFGILQHVLAKVEDPVRFHVTTTSRVPGSRLGSAEMKGKRRLSMPVNNAFTAYQDWWLGGAPRVTYWSDRQEFPQEALLHLRLRCREGPPCLCRNRSWTATPSHSLAETRLRLRPKRRALPCTAAE